MADPAPQAQKQSEQAKKKGKEETDLSPEDLQKKEDIALIVERTQDTEPGVQKLAIEALRMEVKSSSTSISSIPKGLKFLRQHYDTLKQTWETIEGENKRLLADVLSVLAMTMASEGAQESLKFRLEGSKDQIDEWGHEYVRNLAGEITQAFATRQDNNESVDELIDLVSQIVPFNMKHNAEPEACDLLLEVERLSDIVKFVDEANCSRICLYLLGNATYAPHPDNEQILAIVCQIYQDQSRYPEALFVALRLDNMDLVRQIFDAATDEVTKKQLSFILGRQRAFAFEEDNDELAELIGNMKLSEYYEQLARDLSVEEVKAPKDIYKMHLIENRHLANMKLDSAKQNLGDIFVNSFINGGFGTDSLLTNDKDKKWIYKTKETDRISVVASLGLINLWRVDEACEQLDPLFYAEEDGIKAGAYLGVGLACSGIRSLFDPALTLLSDKIDSGSDITRIGAILGLGMAYAGSAREDMIEVLGAILQEPSNNMDVLSITAYSLGLIFVGTCNSDLAELISDILISKEEEVLSLPYAKFMCVGLGLLYLGKQNAAEVTLETLKVLPASIAKYAQFTVQTCAYAGSGDVLKVQEMLKACGKHLEENEEFQGVAVLGIAAIAMGEEIGSSMAIRAFNHLLQYGDPVIRRSVPLALGLISISNPQLPVMDTLSKLSHDSDADVAQGAILALGMIGAGTNNSRIAGLLRQLSAYYIKDPDHLFIVRIAQGLLHLGKGLISLSPYHCHGSLLSKVSLAGILGALHACLDFPGLIHSNGHFFLYLFACAMHPRMLITLDEDLKPLEVSVRVGQAVDTVGQAGKPKTITGFQTHTTPVLIAPGERAELATDDYIPTSCFLENCVILKPNPNKK